MSSFLQILQKHGIFLVSCPLFLFFSLLAIFFVFLIRPTGKRKLILPPSPPKFPIVGNLHIMGHHPHRSLKALAQRFGPIMSLRFGNVPVLVISSADAACEIMKTHDLTLVNRPKRRFFQKLLYDCKDVASAPYGEYWRQMRSICVQNLLSNKRVQSYRDVREEETALAMEKIEKYCSSGLPINLSEIFSAITNNVICRIALGRKYSEDTNKFKKLLRELTELLGTSDVGDYLPWLAWISHVNGFDAKAKKVAKEFDEFLDGDMFSGGTDTTYTALEWIMAELLRHPKVMKELQNEVRKVSSGKSSISEDDIDNMHYLKAVIKESLRLHPPVPLLLPTISTKDVKIKGYDIVKGTELIINAWAIGRDPSSWEKPEEFVPDRFLNNSIDFKGHHFELIPFGSGRRICPGILFAMQTSELFLANLMHKFNWSLPGGANEKDLDMAESFGITVHKSSPLIATANQCSF